jgi:hypothetical protein
VSVRNAEISEPFEKSKLGKDQEIAVGDRNEADAAPSEAANAKA